MHEIAPELPVEEAAERGAFERKGFLPEAALGLLGIRIAALRLAHAGRIHGLIDRIAGDGIVGIVRRLVLRGMIDRLLGVAVAPRVPGTLGGLSLFLSHSRLLFLLTW